MTDPTERQRWHDAEMGNRLKLLVIDPEPARGEHLAVALAERGFDVTCLSPALPLGGAALAGVDVVLAPLDEETPHLAVDIRRADPLLPLVAHSNEETDAAAGAVLGRARVHDVVAIPASSNHAALDALAARLRMAAERHSRQRHVPRIAEDILGTSDRVEQLRRYVHKAASSDANVLIVGESGTGKELIARAIHRHSARCSAAFVAVNCSAIPESLLESHLFGYEKGAFTGAIGRTRGLFEQAAGGTLLFDEVGEAPPSMQSKLLRVLQPPPGEAETVREFTRIGGEEPCRSDVRVLFATHRNLAEEARQGRFREDLLQRIDVLRIMAPPLRDRREDIPLLARTFLSRFAALEGRGPLELDPLVLKVLSSHGWPLNVRELAAAMHSVVILKEAGDTIVLGDLPPLLFERLGADADIGERRAGYDRRGSEHPGEQPEPGLPEDLPTLAEVEDQHVGRVLQAVKGNKSRAARILGISRPALDRKLDRVTPGREADDSEAATSH